MLPKVTQVLNSMYVIIYVAWTVFDIGRIDGMCTVTNNWRWQHVTRNSKLPGGLFRQVLSKSSHFSRAEVFKNRL